MIENSDICSKASESLRQCHRYETVFSNDIPVTPTTASSESFIRTTDDADGPEYVEIPLSYLSNFQIILEFPLLTCEIDVKTTWLYIKDYVSRNVSNENFMWNLCTSSNVIH